nr:uncharacterized protein LOC111997115 [Quercus suber]
MAAQKIVQIGCRWQIGNGDSVEMWSDKWLPTPSSYQSATFPHFFPVDAKVSALINLGTATWKCDIIHEVFLPSDTNAILSIPLSPTMPEDKLIWAYTPSGQFSVSSAYRVYRTAMADPCQGQGSSSQLMSSFWRCLWKLPMPNKIKAFAWRTCRNILSTKVNLHSRKVIPDSICDECGIAVESSGHVFWHCARAKEVLSAANVEFEADLGEGIWTNRNEIRTSGARKSASAIAYWTLDYLVEFQVVNHKIQLGSVGIGVVVRDHFGVVRAALSRKFHGLLGPLAAEAKAMEEGLPFALDHGVNAAICEGDSMVVFNSLTGSIFPSASISNLISGSLLHAARFDVCKFSVVPRNGNRVAHGLAQYAKNLFDSCTWIGDIPPFLEQSVSRDVLCSSSS